MKVLTGLLVVTMLLGLVAGCQQTTEVTYKEVPIASMRTYVPTEWQKPEDIDDVVEEMKSDMAPGTEQYAHFDVYEAPGFSDEIALFRMFMEMSEIIETQGITWAGWDYTLESAGITREDFVPQITAGFVSEGLQEVTHQQTLELTINGSNALETEITGRYEGYPGKILLLLVFTENDLGVVLMVGKESAWEKYEDTWYEIRDSVKF